MRLNDTGQPEFEVDTVHVHHRRFSPIKLLTYDHYNLQLYLWRYSFHLPFFGMGREVDMRGCTHDINILSFTATRENERKILKSIKHLI